MKTRKLKLKIGLMILLGALTLGGAGLPSTAWAGSLDGMTFVGETGKIGKSRGKKDEFIFKDGMLRATGCESYGFADGAYTAIQHGDTVVFHATTESPKSGKIEWKGIVRGSALEGTYVWNRPHRWYRWSNAPKEYWMKAELKE
jgi:hypothetical protein